MGPSSLKWGDRVSRAQLLYAAGALIVLIAVYAIGSEAGNRQGRADANLANPAVEAYFANLDASLLNPSDFEKMCEQVVDLVIDYEGEAEFLRQQSRSE